MKKIILITIFALCCSVFAGCHHEDECKANGAKSGTAACIPPELMKKNKNKDNNESSGPPGSAVLTPGYSLIGQSLLAYPGLESIEDDFDTAMFEANLNRHDEQLLPIYEITTDHDALKKLLSKLNQDRSVTVEHESNDKEDIFKIDRMRIKVNKQTGRVLFVDLEKDHHGAEVEQIDKRLILEQAEKIFKEYIPEDLLKKTYFYRYVEYTNSSALRGGNVVTKPYAAAVALNPVVNDLPVIGSGGKYSVHVESDGSVSSFDLQFSRFNETDKKVSIISPSEAMKELKHRLANDGISLDNHKIDASKFGYYFLSGKGKVRWLIPSYSFIVLPKEGVTDVARVYTFPASHDSIAQKLFDEDIKLETARKAAQINQESARVTPK